jgi:ribosomal protein S18 acetylase RimI-like enzyme
MAFTFVPVSGFGLATTAELLNRAFADYVVQVRFTEALLWQVARVDGIDFSASCVVRMDGQPVGAALVARRGWTSRVAGMALLPAARRRRGGRALMEHLIVEAKARGDRRMVLEVIESNVAAVRLYEAVGFQRVRRLVGFAGPPPANLVAVPTLAEVDLRSVAAALMRQEAINWPWQLAGETIAQLTPPAVSYALDGAWVVLMNPAGPQVTIRALAVDGDEGREARAVRLLRAVMARHPATGWRMSALWPEELGSWFTGAGLERQELAQWQMAREQ